MENGLFFWAFIFVLFQHTDPDYSCAYVTIRLASGLEGNGLTFTNGRGTEVVVQAVKSMSYLVKGKIVSDIYKDFATFWRSLTSESQMRWVSIIWQLNLLTQIENVQYQMLPKVVQVLKIICFLINKHSTSIVCLNYNRFDCRQLLCNELYGESSNRTSLLAKCSKTY